MDSFLRNHVTSCPENASHLSLVGGKYHIPDKDIEEFYHLYSKFHRECHLVEKVRCQVDLQTSTKSSLPTYRSSLKDYQRKTFVVCCVFETPMRMVCTDFYDMHRCCGEQSDSLALCTQYLGTYADLSVYSTGLRMIGSNKKTQQETDILSKVRDNKRSGESDRCHHHTRNIEKVFDTFETRLFCSYGCSKQKYSNTFSKAALFKTKKSPKRAANTIIQNKITRLISVLCIRNTRTLPLVRKQATTTISVLFVDTKYCQNISAEHTDNHVYFVINTKNKRNISKCFCTHETDLSCSEFKSRKRKYRLCRGTRYKRLLD